MSWGSVSGSPSLNSDRSELISTFQNNSKQTLVEKYPITFTTLKIVGIAVQTGAVGYSGWSSGSILGDPLRSDNVPRDTETIATLTFATVLVVISVASVFFRGCKRRTNQYNFADYFANPLIVLGAYFIGAAILSSKNAQQAGSIWNATYNQNLQIWDQNHANKVNFKYQVEDCNVQFNTLGHAFTRPKCALCPMTGTTSTGSTSWGPDSEIDQIKSEEFNSLQYAFFNVNQTICKPSDPYINAFWPDFGSFSANGTLGEWPCNPNMTAILSNRTGAATAIILKAMLMLDPPFVIDLDPVPNRTFCYFATGFGSRPFNFGQVCKFSDVILKDIPKEYQTCLTEHFYEHARNYTAKYVPYVELPKLTYPGRVTKFHDEGYTQENDTFFGISGVLGFLSGIIFEVDYYRRKMHSERKALLIASRA